MSLIDPKTQTIETRSLGGMTINVTVAPRGPATPRGFAMRVLEGICSLLSGMKVTLGYLVRPSTIVTQQYPENRDTLKMFDRFRGQLELIRDENGRMLCNGCQFCEIACPNGSIKIISRRNEVNDKTELDRYVWRMDSCTFCSACVQVCPHEALRFATSFESAVYDRRLLVFSLNDYAGPPSKLLKKAEKNPEELEKLLKTIEPRARYEGPVPMAGTPLAGTPALSSPALTDRREHPVVEELTAPFRKEAVTTEGVTTDG